MPCAWLKITSQYDLSDYAVEVRLDKIGILDYVRDDGSDVYFLDENRQPLYYAVWLIRKDKNYGSVFVRLSLQATVSRTISICYGEENKYPEYNKPAQVFNLYDDFETLDESKWSVKDGYPYVEDGHLVLPSISNIASVQAFGNVEVRVYYKFDDAVNYFGACARHKYTDVEEGEVCFEIDNYFEHMFKMYQRYYDHVHESFDECSNYDSYQDIYQTGVYYEEVLRTITVGDTLVDSRWIGQGYMDNSFSLSVRCGALHEGAIRLFSIGNTVKVDKILVRYVVDPEPTVELTEAPQPPPEEPSPPPPPEQPPPPELKPQPYPKLWLILLPLGLLFIILGRRRKEKEKE
ncbi:MAG: DUF2341 domain-containing protein [Nitrososphaerota archaeon]